jgi:hypothetical protein
MISFAIRCRRSLIVANRFHSCHFRLRALATVSCGLPPFAASAVAMSLEMSLDVERLADAHGGVPTGGQSTKLAGERFREHLLATGTMVLLQSWRRCSGLACGTS